MASINRESRIRKIDWGQVRARDRMRRGGTVRHDDEPSVRVTCPRCGHPSTLLFAPPVGARLRCTECGQRQTCYPSQR